MDYSVLKSFGDDAQPAQQVQHTGSSKAEKRSQRQAQRAAEREQAERQQAEAAAQAAAAEDARASTLRTVKPEKGSAASFLLPPSNVPAHAAGAFVEQLMLERQAREQRQAEARLAARGVDFQQPRPARTLPCHHYQRGHCTYGDSCRYSHDVPQLPAATAAQPTAAAAARPSHARTSSGGSAERVSSAGGSRPRADGLSEEQLAGIRGINTQDPVLSREALLRMGKRPEDLPFYKTVMCNFWKYQGTCPRGKSCTFAHGEADKRPQYKGDDVRRKNPRPPHIQQPLPAPPRQQPQQPQPQQAPVDPAQLMRQAAAAAGRASGGSAGSGGGAGRTVRPYRPYSPPMASGEAPAVPPPPPRAYQPQSHQPQQAHQQPQQRGDVPPEFQLPPQPQRGTSAPQPRTSKQPPALRPRSGPSQPAQGRQQQAQQQRQQARQQQAQQQTQPRPTRGQELHKRLGKSQQADFAQQSLFGLLATSDDDRSESGSDSGSEDSGDAAPMAAAAAPQAAQNGAVHALAELNLDDGDGLDEEVLASFFCPITQELLKEPVVAADGHTYEKCVIEEWLEDHNTSPLTGLPLRHTMLLENTAVKQAIAATKAQRAAQRR